MPWRRICMGVAVGRVMGEERREEARGGAMREVRADAGDPEGAGAGLERTLAPVELLGAPERNVNDPLLGPRAAILLPWSSSRV